MERKLVKIYENETMGEVNIADEVIAIIAGLAAAEVEGVVGMVGSFGGDIVALLGKKNLAKGIQVKVDEGRVSVGLDLVVAYDVSVVELTKKVQEKVKTTIENMLGLEVGEINIKISDVEAKKK